MSRARRLAELLLIAAAYFAAAQLAFGAAVVSGTACPVWPATAIALIAVLMRGREAVPGLFLGAMAANATRPVPALVVLATALANTAEPFVTRALLRRLRVDMSLVTAADVARFTASVAVAAIVSVLGGVGGLLAAGIVTPDTLGSTAGLWWLGNVVGAICVAPLVLVVRTRGDASRVEEIVVVGLALLVGTVVLGRTDFQVYSMFPVLIWAGLRLGPRGAAGVGMIFAAITVTYAARGTGPFVQSTPTATLLACQGFILVTALTTLLLAAVTEDRRRAGRALERSEEAKRALAEEQTALLRVAEGAARAEGADAVFAVAARELSRLLDVDLAAVVEYVGDDQVRVVAEEGRHARPDVAGTVMAVARNGAVDRARHGGLTRHKDNDRASAFMGMTDRLAAPITVDLRIWGAVLVARSQQTPDPERVGGLLLRVADIVSLAVAEDNARRRLQAQATTDPLTGLRNHRAIHERLREETARAKRHGRPLSVAIFDIDNFKTINDTFGHGHGDHVLAEAARRLRAASRLGELVGRVGGDELAVILPEVEGVRAYQAAERLRRVLGAEPYDGLGAVTASAGVCDLAQAGDPERLFELADGALYWAKAHGRDVCFRYSPEVVEELSAAEKADRLVRSQALSGVRALARAIDAKDSSTIRHSERVSDLVGELARRRGWPEARVALLREAGLVHDVGKIGVPDVILFKRGRLTAEEFTQIQRHAVLGEEIAREVLGAEQASWIRWHHERHDGTGYPDGLVAAAIPEGATLLALADAWDAMTLARHYSTPMSVEAALRECNDQSGRQFAPAAVDALNELMRARAESAA